MSPPPAALDEKSYADLVAEARRLIPGVQAGWTDHNPSDPGIMLVELFAWLSDMLMYRIDRVPDRSYRTFLRLLRGPADPDPVAALPLDEAMRVTLAELRDRYRAVTCDDHEYLTLRAWPNSIAAAALGLTGVLRRARCLAQDNQFNLWLVPSSLTTGRSDLAAFDPARRLVLELDGTSGYVDAGNDPSLRLTSDLTLSAWIFPRKAVTAKQGLVAKNPAGEFELVLEPGGGLTFYQADASAGGTVATNLPVGRWSHVAAVRSAQTISFFVDGKRVGAPAPLAKPAVVSTQPVVLGKRAGTGGFFNGFLRDVCVWKVARSEVELGGDLKRPLLGSEPGLVACWHLDDGGTVAADAATPVGVTPRPRDGKLMSAGWRDAVRPLPASPELVAGLTAFFEPRRQLTSKLSIGSYKRLPVTVQAKLYLRSDGVASAVRAAALAAVDGFLDPLTGGAGEGWPIGRHIFGSELTAALDALPGVDFVKDVGIALVNPSEPGRPAAPLGDDGTAIGVALLPHELPDYVRDASAFNLFQRVGTKWQPT